MVDERRAFFNGRSPTFWPFKIYFWRMKHTISLSLFLFLSLSLRAQQRGEIVSFHLLESLTADSLSTIVQQNTGFPGAVLGITYDFDVYRVRYWTRGYHPDSLTIATGLTVIPTNYPCDLGIFSFGHGLSCKDTEVPSHSDNIYGVITKGLASNGYIGVAPDYIFMGSEASPGLQAFMNAKTEAAATIDLIRATQTFCAQNNIGTTGQIFLSGYSQGGHSSMATAREMQLFHPGEFNLVAAVPGGGTYDLSGVACDSLLSPTRTTPERQAFPLVACTYVNFYMDTVVAEGFQVTPSNFVDVLFESPYDSLMSLILDRTNPFYNTSQLDSIPVRMLEDSFQVPAQTDPDFFFRRLLSHNNLYDWAPQMPLMMVHSDADIENPYSNVVFTQQQFQQNGSTSTSIYTLNGYSHPGAGLPYVLIAKDWIGTFRQDCLNSVEQADDLLAELPVFPNPSQGCFSIKLPEIGNFKIMVFDALGGSVAAFEANGGLQSSCVLEGRAPGLYGIRVLDGTGRLLSNGFLAKF